ncbi:MAG: zinc ribbon domain-containing protein [Chloroflexota bacterium]
MTEPAEATEETGPHCPWCSASVSDEDVTCPSCGAVLREEGEHEIPGVTQVDPKSAALQAPEPAGGGVIGWLSGEYVPDPTKAELASVEPPTDAVRREMLKIEVDALRAELQAREAERDTEAREAAEDDGRDGTNPSSPPG